MFATTDARCVHLQSPLSRTRSPQLGGCDFAADPTLPAHAAKVFWSPEFALDTLTLSRLPDELAGTRRAGVLPPADAAAVTPGDVHLLLSDGLAAQLWLLGAPTDGAALGLLLPLDDDLPVRLAAALDLWRRMHGRAPERVRLTQQRRRRLVDGLRALDGKRAHASVRDITRVLFPAFELRTGPEWKTDPHRAQTMRLIADATALMRGGYRDLLRRGRPAR